MGRHSAGDQWAFYRSVTKWVLPWVLIAALVGIGVWFVVRPEGGGLRAQPSTQASPEPSSSPTLTPSPTPGPTGGSAEKDDGEVAPPPLITDGVTVQVLNSVRTGGAQDRMVDRLVALGFAVPYEAEASTAYGSTTVFWSYPEAERVARRLAERFGWAARPKPGNLSSGVTIHVVVGRDEAKE